MVTKYRETKKGQKGRIPVHKRLRRLVLLSAERNQQKDHNTNAVVFLLVPGQGFEPRYSGPKPDVLPLDDPGM